MNYNGAFECHDCPRNNDPENGRACPAWWETVWTRAEDNKVQTKIQKGCGIAQLPSFLEEVVKASNRPTHQMSELQNVIGEGLGKINQSVIVGFNKLKMLETSDVSDK